MVGKKRSRLMYIAAFGLIFSGVAYLMVASISQNSTYFLEVSEALAVESHDLGKARLFGMVGNKDIVRDKDSLGVAFNLVDKQDKDKVIRVQYSGAVPDLFDSGVEVIVEGGLDPSRRVFMASSLMTKCASKYESAGGSHPDEVPY
ncbi:MAG: cytochrome c maturation protein CcmE [Desulfonatronovibrionaceae bacterium]